MGRMRAWLRRLERASSEEMIKIPQRDGSTAKFRQSDLWEAYLNTCERLGAGEAAPPIHPLSAAAANSSDATWRQSAFAEREDDGVTDPVPDLSETSEEE